MAQKIIVTGANGGLGTQVTQHLLNEGYEVHATIIPNGPEPEEAKSAFEQNERLHLKKVDALDQQQVQQYVENLGDVYGGVLTVGGFQMKPFLKTTQADLDRMIDLNFRTAFNFALPLARHFKEKGTGRLFFIGSKPAVEKGGRALTSYSLSKGMLTKLAEIANEELQGTEATATLVVPDLIDTPANRQAMPDADFSQWVKPSEIARIIGFYLTPQAQRLREPILKIYGNPA